jgi:hypothetical protein
VRQVHDIRNIPFHSVFSDSEIRYEETTQQVVIEGKPAVCFRHSIDACSLFAVVRTTECTSLYHGRRSFSRHSHVGKVGWLNVLAVNYSSCRPTTSFRYALTSSLR